MDLPKKAQRLIDLAEEHGWRVEQEPFDLEGATEAVGLAFYRALPSGRSFFFMVGFAKVAWSGRWQALKTDGYAVTGTLLPGDGSARDEIALVYGSALEERSWRRVKDLRWWLAHPEDVLAFEWVGEAEATRG